TKTVVVQGGTPALGTRDRVAFKGDVGQHRAALSIGGIVVDGTSECRTCHWIGGYRVVAEGDIGEHGIADAVVAAVVHGTAKGHARTGDACTVVDEQHVGDDRVAGAIATGIGQSATTAAVL